MLNYKYIGISVVLYSLHFSQFCMGLVSCQLIVQLSLFSFWYFIFIFIFYMSTEKYKIHSRAICLVFHIRVQFFPCFPSFVRGMVSCFISAQSFSQYIPEDGIVWPLFSQYFLGILLCGIGIYAPSLSKYFPGDGIMWRLFPHIFLGMVLCGIGISGYPRPGDGIMWHICAQFSQVFSWGWYFVAYLRLVFPGIFLGMVLCGISAPSFFKYLHLMWHICTFLSKNIFLGMVWHICTICTNQLSKPTSNISSNMFHIAMEQALHCIAAEAFDCTD